METVKIAVCDDDRAMQDILRQKIEKFCTEQKVEYQIVCFASGEEMLQDRQMPAVLFLDIQMPGKNGMKIAEELRKKQKGIIIIFVTALSEYVYDAFDVGAFHYLVKPFRDDKLREVLERALQQYWEQQAGQNGEEEKERQAEKYTAILVKRGGISTKVPLENIIYAEVFNRKVMLHTTSGDIEYYGKLTDLEEQAGADFYRTHRAYLVNLKYVEKYNAAEVWLEQGTALISKKQFSGFVRRYMQYINRAKNIEKMR